jgi:hypothetical protein
MPEKYDEFFAALIPGVQMHCPVCNRTTKWIRLSGIHRYGIGSYTSSSKLICSAHDSLDGHNLAGMPELKYEIDMTYGEV